MEKDKFIITLDSGTTSVRSLVINKKGEMLSVAQQEIQQIYPNSGWVEHNPLEIWNSQKTTMVNAKNELKIKSTQIAAVGITNQRETIVVWNKNTGLPIYNAIVWQDRRTSKECEELIEQGKDKIFLEKTGLILNPYFSGTKLKWILDNVEGAREKAKNGELLAGTIDTWLIWNLTNGQVHATDVTNASRTLLYNINTLEWDQELLDILDIPANILPEVKNSSDNYGIIAQEHFSHTAEGVVPITGVAGDQQSALFGQMCTNVGDVKNTYGTGCFTLVNTGKQPIFSKNRLLTTIAWKLPDQKPIYALEGSVFIAGASIQWLRDSLRLIYDSPISDYYAKLTEKNDQEDLYVVPAFTGLGAPYWDSDARGLIIGIERSTKREHIVAATLESIGYQTNDLIQAMAKDIGKPIKSLFVDGGVSKNNFLMEFQASISKLEVVRPKNIETTAMGAGFLAGLYVKYWKDISEIKKLQKESSDVFVPKLSDEKVERLLKGWKEAVSRSLGWKTLTRNK